MLQDVKEEKLRNLRNNYMLSGKKTFLVCIAGLIYGVVGGIAGFVSWDQAILIIEAALIGAGFRDGLRSK